MTCRNCGKALSNEQATCPFCGVFIASDQIKEFIEMKKEKSKDLRPKLISEKYGISPIKYEKKEGQGNLNILIILVICGFIMILFFVTLFIFF